jgi:hypothetical protein
MSILKDPPIHSESIPVMRWPVVLRRDSSQMSQQVRHRLGAGSFHFQARVRGLRVGAAAAEAVPLAVD